METVRAHIDIGVVITQHRKGINMLKKFKNDQLEIHCLECGDLIKKPIKGFEPKFLKEFGQYENLTVECQKCKTNGKEVHVHINLNIPEGEMDEEDLEFEMTTHEINARKYVRDLMWSVRPDLKGKDRAKFNKERKRVPKEIVEAKKRMFGNFDSIPEKPGI